MPINTNGYLERLFDWTDDRDAGVKIRADRMDQEMDGIVDAINKLIGGQIPYQGRVLGVSGTVANPAFSFVDDPGSGLYRDSAGVLGLAAGGTKVALLSSTAATMQVDLKLKGAPTDPLHAATKQYVDDVSTALATTQTALTNLQNSVAQLESFRTGLMAGSQAEMDTFLEAYNEFQAQGSAITALNNLVATKAASDHNHDGAYLLKLAKAESAKVADNAHKLGDKEISHFLAQNSGYGVNSRFGKYFFLRDYDDGDAVTSGLRCYVRDGRLFLSTLTNAEFAEISLDGRPVWHTGNLTKAAIKNILGNQHLYRSPDQTIVAGGLLTLAHGLGVEPNRFQAYLVRRTANHGYSIGDRIPVYPYTKANGSGHYSFTIVADTTNIEIRFANQASVFQLLSHTDGSALSGMPADWHFTIEAWRQD